MRTGFSLPQFATMDRQFDQIARFAREAEALGAGSLWVGDRVLAAVDPAVGYGGSTCKTIPPEMNSVLDPFVALSVAAAVTETALLGTCTLIAPWYPPLLLARSLSGIDVVSRGRLIAGLGIGWSPDEYEGVGVPWKERGARLDECLDILESIWTTAPVPRHDGPHHSIPAAHIGPKPVQSPRPPVYLSALSPAAQRRAARRADGVLPIAMVVPGGSYDPKAAVTAQLQQVRALAETQGRDPAEVDAILRINAAPGTTPQNIADVIRHTEDETDVDHVFVDLGYLVDQSVDQALDLAGQVLELSR
ncbi:TIGR03619 family F420-dependent LLM class oxidoreductase [Streptomyces acidiscabies]|uniref:TIGR03619 family F420-dependent LLM class oxidoreductase n=1 Tax=Streptomyces acidiscabies TaxID=42234 RepID=A0AAP6EJG9_9ACTN|nr:TIGR03619 family F420-dependent LLM class oxidoreductase [Streptomyces acidiscabies]MBZ3913893.1 TIGR03619 family F420-dependent LLM class oxidoreductase [Streptomyces acidiscabies]MDX2964520.1 TIGR03619 family F420-dependent LLM class oxidoreductase [Streptomyces acidiscabies]MDX3022016.1 TIGR03619 family F420-dependent LLM class oxidoreductase [Streptomyces acidiscabies]MDX3793580.1 TIGR03619 family F420-dependent LLM class oxidoreductase [Streptomyces acidiscabies]GAV37563.1 phthiodiolon